MSRKKTIHVGDVFGKLTLIDDRYVKNKRTYLALCECECGNKRVVYPTSLIRMNVTDCGCAKVRCHKSKYDKYKILGMPRAYRLQLLNTHLPK